MTDSADRRCNCPVSSGEGAWNEAHDPACASLTKPDSADRHRERPQQLTRAIADAMFDSHDPLPSITENRYWIASRVCAALGLDPDTVVDGPLVVLHPGQHVVEQRPETSFRLATGQGHCPAEHIS